MVRRFAFGGLSADNRCRTDPRLFSRSRGLQPEQLPTGPYLCARDHCRLIPAAACCAPAFVAAQAYKWSGFYIGAHLGGASFTNQNVSADPAGATFPAGYVFTPQNGDSFIGGGQVGYDAQFGNLVVGWRATSPA
jgi:hypothetical protein